MRAKSSGLRFQTPLRLQGRDGVRVICSAEEAADWFDETWDPVVRERLRLMGQALRPVIGLALHGGSSRARNDLA